jgi:hypothetical protein
MAFIGNTVTTQGFTPAIDYFNGDGSTTAFTLSRPVASVAQVQVVVNNVPQLPGTAYTVSGSTITFTGAPSSGTSNIYVYYTSPITQVIQPSQGTVGTAQLVDASVTTAKLSSTTGTGSVALASLPTFTTTIGVGGATASASGSGISFPATQSASSDANTLDDYEEGTWTANLYGSTTNPTTPVTATAKYTKIGNLVTIFCRFANKDTSGASGILRVSGLPFTPSGDLQCGSVASYGLSVPNLYNVLYVVDGVNFVEVMSISNNGAWTETNITAGTTKYLTFTVTYFV